MKKILVANRGEIAIRVMRTAKKMGIKTVAIFSEADRNAPHVRYADEAVCVGPPPSAESYLLGSKIISEAKKLGVDGIHPGYGFLSENAEFAEEVENNNITFIGPGSKAIRIMGSKLAAKEAVKKYDIPMVPGIDKAITDIEQAKIIAATIGFPILIKASAGGGGKGMRIVEREKDLESQMKMAIGEATAAFGDGSVFIEKYVTSPRHIEIQVLADKHGNILHFFERECSVQRRHQKVVEEAPSSVLTPEMRNAMGEAAVNVARSCDYVGAGTVEFLLDADHNFYFLEMNTRLQVEHTITEAITGIDIVKEQFRIADGLSLKYTQADIKRRGYAMELRINAEDPKNDFLPSFGRITRYFAPGGPGVRTDAAIYSGYPIPPDYDSMCAKLTVWALDWDELLSRATRALMDTGVYGVKTTIPYYMEILKVQEFREGSFDTGFVEDHPELTRYTTSRPTRELTAAITAALSAHLGL